MFNSAQSLNAIEHKSFNQCPIRFSFVFVQSDMPGKLRTSNVSTICVSDQFGPLSHDTGKSVCVSTMPIKNPAELPWCRFWMPLFLINGAVEQFSCFAFLFFFSFSILSFRAF